MTENKLFSVSGVDSCYVTDAMKEVGTLRWL